MERKSAQEVDEPSEGSSCASEIQISSRLTGCLGDFLGVHEFLVLVPFQTWKFGKYLSGQKELKQAGGERHLSADKILSLLLRS